MRAISHPGQSELITQTSASHSVVTLGLSDCALDTTYQLGKQYLSKFLSQKKINSLQENAAIVLILLTLN